MPDNRIKRPEANGSSVPVWPVRACVRRRSSATRANEDGPGGSSSSATPTGLEARGGTSASGARGRDELAVDELDDLLERQLAREPGRLDMPAAVRLASDRRDVQVVRAR